ncbi:MAG: hypothetical protein ACM3ST_02340 [Bdellovibrio bacteriovorus]
MPHRRLLAASLLLTAGLAWAAGQTVSFSGLTSEVPSEWVGTQPSSTMRLLQFDIPGAGGGEGAQFVVYYFGPGQGGSLDANLERWASQFRGPEGKPVEPVVTPLKSTMPATLVELRGSYARNVGMGQSGEALPDRMLLAALVETPDGNLYPQLHGPADLVTAQRPAFIAFIEGIRAGAAP